MALGLNATADYLIRTSGFVDYDAAKTVFFRFLLRAQNANTNGLYSITRNTAPGGNAYDVADWVGFSTAGTELHVGCFAATSQESDTSDTLAASTWYSAALVRESTTSLKIYLNGTLTHTLTTDVSARNDALYEVLGPIFSGTDVTDCILEGYKEWAAALNATEIATEHTYLNPVRTANLNTYCSFATDGSASTGTGFTLNGTVTTETGSGAPTYTPGVTMTAAQGSYALTGQDVGLFAGFGLTAGQGTYNLTGRDAGLLQRVNVAAGQGTYNLTGQAATTSYGGAAATTMVAAQGSYALNGQAANLLAGFGLVAGQGQYTLTGQNANTSRTRAVDIFWLQVAGNAGYAYEYGTTSGGPYTSGSGTVGTDVLTALLTGLTERTTYFWRVMALPDGPWSSEGTFTTGIPPLVAEQGSYALTGQDAITGVGRGVSAAQGAYALNGQAASLLAGYTLVASQGAYALSGQDALTSKTGGYVMGAGVGSYSLNGQDVVTSRSGVTAMLADQGSYSLFGQDVVTNKSSTYVMVATSGNYDLQGQDAVLSRTVVVTLTAEMGLYALSGQDIGFKCTYALIAEYGNYTVTFMGTGAGSLNVFFVPSARRHMARL